MNNLTVLLLLIGGWWLICAILRDLGFQWRTLFIFAMAWGIGAMTIWFYVSPF